MSLTTPFEQARAALGVPAGADRAAVKRAYRAAVAEHPPDRDPDGFRRVRESYELLVDPTDRARDLILSRRPSAPPPPLPAPPEPPRPGVTAVALLRVLATRVDAAALLARAEAGDPPAPAKRARAPRVDAAALLARAEAGDPPAPAKRARAPRASTSRPRSKADAKPPTGGAS